MKIRQKDLQLILGNRQTEGRGLDVKQLLTLYRTLTLVIPKCLSDSYKV